MTPCVRLKHSPSTTTDRPWRRTVSRRNSDYRRIDVGRRTGCFHPKVLLLLVDDHHEATEPVRQALVVGLLSANLTRAGWWENLECAHLDEIKDREVDDQPCAFRTDLLALIQLIKRTAREDDDQSALERIHEFILTRTQSQQRGSGASRAGSTTRGSSAASGSKGWRTGCENGDFVTRA